MFARQLSRGVGVGRKAAEQACGGLLGLLVACGGASPPQTAQVDDSVLRDEVLDEVMAEETAKREARHASRSAKTDSSASSGRTRSTVGVRGITGSLNAFEVEQAMSTRRAQLLACVEQRPRALAHVAGEIAFHIDLDGHGKVERAVVIQSDIGYTPLEDCLLAVVAAAPFPVPAGKERTQAEWRMSVDPLREPALPLDSTELEETIAREAEAAYESCEVPKARRFAVNGYLAHGKLHPVSVRAPWQGAARTQDDAPEQVVCLAQALAQWSRWPKQDGQAKVSFELHWVKAPPPKKRGRAHRRG
jgi:hypothetical protein